MLLDTAILEGKRRERPFTAGVLGCVVGEVAGMLVLPVSSGS